MVRIYLRALKEAKANVDREGGMAFRMDVVMAQFTKEEKAAVKEGMRLLTVEEVGVQLEDDDQGADAGKSSLLSFRNLIAYCLFNGFFS